MLLPVPERLLGAPRSIQAAYLHSKGASRHAIAEAFGWTINTASTNIARGKRWQKFIQRNAAWTKTRRASVRAQRRPDAILAELRALAVEARRLRIAEAHILEAVSP